MKQGALLCFLYSLFAAIATAANLLAQAIVVFLSHGPYAIELSILIGTMTGLPVKYLLDKHYIFVFKTRDVSHDSQVFLLYTFTGVFTTLLFWGVEYYFQWLFGTDMMRYFGGAVGLMLGYIIKYHLDKRYVFISQ